MMPSGGLSSAQASQRLAQDGPNVIPAQRQRPWPLELAGQMVHFFALMLWIAAVLALIAGMAALAVAIVAVVVVNGTFAFLQEYRADRAAARLRDLIPARVTVIRDGRRITVEAADLVVGDLLAIEAGDRISADCVITKSAGIAVDESALTGESSAVHRGNGEPLSAGTYCFEGTALAVAAATGRKTRLAGVAAMTRNARRPVSPLTIALRRVVRTIAIVAIAVGITAFGSAVVLGMGPSQGFLFAIGVTVALVPEGLLPTVTLSLARTAQRMARLNALVRHLESIETLGATTFICTDKTGTLTRNQMSAVVVWTPAGEITLGGVGYEPRASVTGPEPARAAAAALAEVAVRTATGRLLHIGGQWRPQGDPTEVALHVLGLRLGVPDVASDEGWVTRRFPFDPRRRMSSVLFDHTLLVMGAPDSVLARCQSPDPAASAAAARLTEQGLRVLAFARRDLPPGIPAARPGDVERELRFVGLAGLEDPPRDSAIPALAACRRAGIKVAMVTGDHPGTALAIARQIGLTAGRESVLVGADLPDDELELGLLLDNDGVIVARATPEDKLRIAHALQLRGHVVAMTGDGVNDGPALREADIGIAMGASGTDVAREAADVVLLDDRFSTIVSAIELGRATFANIRRFLTYHLTDNVAELTPFLVWTLTVGNVPLAIGVLQILALDIGTDLLPALALGGEPPAKHTLDGPVRQRKLIDAPLLRRVFGVLGPAEALAAMGAFAGVLLIGGWTWGQTPGAGLLAAASGTAFASIVLGQLTNAYACRSETRWVPAVLRWPNSLLPWAIASELVLLFVFLGVPAVAAILGGSFPSLAGWALALLAIPAVILFDGTQKAIKRSRRTG